jgi:membrane-bound serine protease (clpP class)
MFYIILLILLGVLFLVAELLLLPGISVGTVLSLVCYGSAIYLAFDGYGTLTGAITVAVVLLLSLITTLVSLRAKTWQRLSLKQEIDSSSMQLPEKEISVGARGISVSRLSPMGKVEIDGKSYEAKSADVFIDQKQPVEVVGFDNFAVIVKKAE